MNQWSDSASRGCSRRAAHSPISSSSTVGRGSCSAAYAALEQLGLANLVAVGLAEQEGLVFTRDRDEPLALPRSAPRYCCCSRSATRPIDLR